MKAIIATINQQWHLRGGGGQTHLLTSIPYDGGGQNYVYIECSVVKRMQ